MHLIALRQVRYADSKSILTAYSLEGGILSLLVAGGATREAARRRALLMPLGLVEAVVHQRPGRDIHPMSQLQPSVALHGVYSHPMKQAVALFLGELLASVLRDSHQPDAQLYEYLKSSILVLDALEPQRLPNYCICFLYGLGRALGIEPDVASWRPGRVFDMVEGTFRSTPPLHSSWLPAEESRFVALLGRITFANMHHFRLSSQSRSQVLDQMLAFYSMHVAPLTSLHSLDILRVL